MPYSPNRNDRHDKQLAEPDSLSVAALVVTAIALLILNILTISRDAPAPAESASQSAVSRRG